MFSEVPIFAAKAFVLYTVHVYMYGKMSKNGAPTVS